jgi:hypothetical protein
MARIVKTWIPCLLRKDDRFQIQAKNEGDILNSTGYFILHYRIPTQALRGPKNTRELHVDGFRVGIYRADSRNYINEIRLIGVTYHGATVVWKESTNLTRQEEKEYTIQGSTGADLSDFAAFDVALLGRTMDRERLAVAYVSAKCWYSLPKARARRRVRRKRDNVTDGDPEHHSPSGQIFS